MNQQEILGQAKRIMDNFHNELAKSEKEAPASKVEREEFEREETGGQEADPEFRSIMLKNAPRIKNDCIEAEKGKWL